MSLQAASLFDKYAESYQERFMDVSMYSKSLDFLGDEIKIYNAEVLDVACGPGNISKYLLNRKPDLKITGVDLAPKMIELAQINNPTANYQLLDARNILNLGKKFDVVVFGFAYPYFNKQEVKQSIDDARNILNSNGLIYISTMEDDYSNSKIEKTSKGDDMMMYYHEEKYLRQFLEQNNFKVLFVDRVNTTMTNGKEVVDLSIIARCL